MSLFGDFPRTDASPRMPSSPALDGILCFNPFVDVQPPQVLRRVPHAIARAGEMEWFDGEDMEHPLGTPHTPNDHLR